VDRSLTILLPVRNAQTTLSDTVTEVLEVACELTDNLELVIVDDGSTDATSEVAHDLTIHYPQVKVCSHGSHMGDAAAIKTGLQHASGEVVVLRDGTTVMLDEQLHVRGRPSRPNYLGHLKNFAFGE
jgi:dolichol-phosphate mannosyltransferase